MAVLGAGTLGLATVAALGHLAGAALPRHRSVVVGAKYAHQRALAGELGADLVVAPDQLARAVRRHSRSLAIGGTSGGRLTGGADVVIDCVGTRRVARPGARHGAAPGPGRPGRACRAGLSVDLASLWHREVRLAGAYAYGTEDVRAAVAAAAPSTSPWRWSRRSGLGRLVSATYPLDRFEEAVAHAGAAGRRGAVKVVFDLRPSTAEEGRR